jgi:hypothetical protein
VNSAQLLEWLRVRPFQPFRIVMTDGGCLDIFHPEQVIPFRGTAIVGRRTTAAGPTSRDVNISLLHVIRLEPLDEA